MCGAKHLQGHAVGRAGLGFERKEKEKGCGTQQVAGWRQMVLPCSNGVPQVMRAVLDRSLQFSKIAFKWVCLC